MDAQPSPALPVEFKDRSSGLIIFGILTIILGGLCALMVPLMIFGATMAAKANGPVQPLRQMIPVAMIYGSGAVALVWLGVGAIQAKRWARALLLISSWGALVMGLLIIPVMLYVMSHLDEVVRQGMPAGKAAPAMPGFVIAFTMLIMSAIFLVLPLVWLVFFQSRHVKATCEARHPMPCWTDACPLPVLAVSLWLATGAPMMLLMPLTANPVAPFFGQFITGIPGTLFYLVMAGVWAYCAHAVYKLDVRGWWIILVFMVLFGISHVLTYSQHEFTELYRLMGYRGKELEQMTKYSFMSGPLMTWGAPAALLPLFALLYYIKRYFGAPPPPVPGA